MTKIREVSEQQINAALSDLDRKIGSEKGEKQVNSDWNSTSGVSMILNKPKLAEVATSGSYNDLSDKPIIPGPAPVTSVNGRVGAVVLDAADVDALPNNTHIPVDPVQADWTEVDSTQLDYIKNKPTLATVATSGNYNDLSNKPTILSLQDAFDAAHPIGEVYTQYPGESTPATVYNVGGIQSTWTELDYGGAFFRAKGGNANDYDKELTVATIGTHSSPNYVSTITFSETYTFSDKPVLIFNGEVLNVQEVRNGTTIVLTVLPDGLAVGSKVLVSQGNTTAVNGLHTNSSADGTGIDGRTPTGGSHEHRITANCEGGTGNEGTTNFITGSASKQPTKTMNSKNKANTTNSSHYHEIYLFGDEETRPENFTIRIWKRTA